MFRINNTLLINPGRFGGGGGTSSPSDETSITSLPNLTSMNGSSLSSNAIVTGVLNVGTTGARGSSSLINQSKSYLVGKVGICTENTGTYNLEVQSNMVINNATADQEIIKLSNSANGQHLKAYTRLGSTGSINRISRPDDVGIFSSEASGTQGLAPGIVIGGLNNAGSIRITNTGAQVSGNGSMFQLQSTDYCYMEFYPKKYNTEPDSSRYAYLGITNTGSPDVNLASELGDLNLLASDGIKNSVRIGSGTTSISGNGNLLQLEGVNSSYLDFYPKMYNGEPDISRYGYIGISNTGSDDMYVQATVGDLYIETDDVSKGIITRVGTNWLSLFDDISTVFYRDIVPSADNINYCGNPGFRWAGIWAANGTIQTSDETTKDQIADSPLGLNFISKLRPINYKFKDYVNKIQLQSEKDPLYEYKTMSFTRKHYGFSAQQVESVILELGMTTNEFGGYIDPVSSGQTGPKGLRYDEFICPIVKSIQELNQSLTEEKLKVSTLESKVSTLESQLITVLQRIETLETYH